MSEYDHTAIEKKWQDEWARSGIYKTGTDSSKPKQYILDMFPYPSGEGLHVGHPKGYIATDVYSRMKRMQGYTVLHPMGWDAFGLPAENFAIKNKVHPRVAVDKNISNFKHQLSLIGLDYDWAHEINTTDPAYYKWTQWIFIQLLKKGLAYESFEPINWCPSCQTGLANEDLNADGTCERCDSVVEKRPMRQWVLRIKEYADRLLHDLDTLDWPEHIKEQQRNWIGRSEGAEITFAVEGADPVVVFTTRPDTLMGVTFLVVAPEHALARTSTDSTVSTYVRRALGKSEIERTGQKAKTGVLLPSVRALHPVTQEKLPIYVADYVLATYGTAAIMAVPDLDERDGEFARTVGARVAETKLMSADEALKVSDGVRKVQYRIQDWVFSRQRYWGEPIPVVHCEKDGVVPVPEAELPVTLPDVEHYEPTGTGESPLANIETWVNTKCPVCGAPAKRETNTMPQWAGSSWYWLRFMDPANNSALVAPENEKRWGPVDLYVGGDHAVRHLIYARFWHKFLFDIGVVHTIEPFARLEFLGFILAEDGRKMSKRWANVINPNDVIDTFGADAFRTYEMFMGPFENTIAWSTNGLVGTRRFIERLYRAQEYVVSEHVPQLDVALNATIKKVGDDIADFKFNTAVSQMMILQNEIDTIKKIGKDQYATYLKLVAPFAPHVTEELWHELGHTSSIHLEPWPEYDEAKLVSNTVTIAVQVAGKTRGTVALSRGAGEEEVLSAIFSDPKLMVHAPEKPTKVVFVKDRIINLIP
ncbi:leucine--tRNA ligase [Patescibacteria group bacterium]|nr:leucine--tRNA ligase [Patescibacteria group bacterium]